MTTLTFHDTPRSYRGSTHPRSQALHVNAMRTVHAAKSLLAQGLRMLLVVSCFAAAAAAVIAARLYAFVPALHQ
jgi:hypothetical protein